MIPSSMGYFEIGIFQPRNTENIGTLWRSAWQLGASGIFTIGRRQREQTTDVLKVAYKIPLRHYETLEEFNHSRPVGAEIIGVEMGGTPLKEFVHPLRAVYLLGSEANGLSHAAMESCNHVVEIESVRYPSYNVAVSGSLVMYHRLLTSTENSEIRS